MDVEIGDLICLCGSNRDIAAAKYLSARFPDRYRFPVVDILDADTRKYFIDVGDLFQGCEWLCYNTVNGKNYSGYWVSSPDWFGPNEVIKTAKKSVETMKSKGLACINPSCATFNEWAEPNFNGEYLCYSCRDNPMILCVMNRKVSKKIGDTV